MTRKDDVVLPYGRQWIAEMDLQMVMDSLRSNYLTTGPDVVEFEERFARFVNAKYAVALCNATSALHLAMRVAGIGPGDRVFTSPNTFLASANCAAFVGAIPDFVDIDPISYNLDADTLEAAWLPDTKAVVAVDYAGQSADLPKISSVARARGAVIIEDACHSVGGRFERGGQVYAVGGHQWADMTIFSFHPVKTMTTGEGGMLVTDNEDFASRARMFRTHGIVRERSQFSGLGWDENPDFVERGPWYYEMVELGWNYRITEFQCALGLSQLTRLPAFIQRRMEIVSLYNEALSGLTWLQTPGLRNPNDRDLISWHLYTVQMDFRYLGKSRTEVMSELLRRGVGTQVLYIPVHLQPWYRRTYGYGPRKCPVAERCYPRLLSLPLYPAMGDEDVKRVVDAVRALAPKRR